MTDSVPNANNAAPHHREDEAAADEVHDAEVGTAAGRPGSLLVIFLTVFIDLLGFGIVLPLLPLYADQFGEDPSGFMIGMLMAIFSIMQFVFAPIWGAVSDKTGRRPVIIVGLVGSVVFYTLFGIATIYQSLTGLFLTRIGAGIAGATVSTAQAYIADTTSNENRARGMALIGVAFGLGFTLGPLFAYFAVAFSADEQTPGAGPGFVAAGLSLIALVLAIFVLPESKTATSTNKARRWYDPAAWQTAFQTSALIYLLIGFFICIFAFANFETTLSMLIKGSKNFENAPFNFSFREVCGTFALIGLMVAIVQGGIVRRLAKKISEQKLAVAGAVIEIAGFGVMTYAVQAASTAWLFTALAIIVAGYSLLQPSLYSLLSRWSDPGEQGKVLGVGQSVSAMARIFGSALGIPMLKATLFLPYVMASVLMLAVAGMIMLANKSGKDF
jgi:MFS family permease